MRIFAGVTPDRLIEEGISSAFEWSKQGDDLKTMRQKLIEAYKINLADQVHSEVDGTDAAATDDKGMPCFWIHVKRIRALLSFVPNMS